MKVQSSSVSRGRAGVAAIAIAVSVIGAAACDDATGPDTPLVVTAATIEAVGDTVVMTAVGNPAGVVWSSLDPDIVTITSSGIATGKAAGTGRVQAKAGSRVATAAITVLPAAEVQIWHAALTVDGAEQEKMTLRLRNMGGRGYYRLEVYRWGSNGEPVPVLIDVTDLPTTVGMDVQFTAWLTVPAGAVHAGDWVVVRSREGSLGTLRPTSCVLLHGEGQCVIP
jgi:hypothetical protein